MTICKRLLLAAFALGLAPAFSHAQTVSDLDVFLPIPDGAGGTVPIRSCIIHRPGALASQPPSPVVIEWTTYSLTPNSQPSGGCPPQFGALANLIVPEGYIYIAANPRGVETSGNPGDLTDNWGTRDGRDGARLVEWVSTQPWSNGKVGVVGCSNSAMSALQLAVNAGPHLRALSVGCAALDSYRGAFYPGGIRNWTVWTFFARAGVDVTGPYIANQLAVGQFDWVNRVLSDNEIAATVFTQTTDTPLPAGGFWEEHSTRNTIDNITVPVYWDATWHDFFSGGPEWAMLHQNSVRGDRITFYPGWHGAYLGTLGAYAGLQRIQQWFDYQLRGIVPPYAGEKPVVWWENEGGWIDGIASTNIYHRFYQADIWPPPQVQYRRYYLQPGRVGGSPSSLNDGGLATTAPPASGLTNLGDPYPYPCTACPGQTNDPLGGVGSWNNWPAAVETAGGATTFSTAPLAQPLHLAGPVTVHLWATSTANDTDFVVKLLTVHPDGSFQHIANGWLKASHRAIDTQRTRYQNVSGNNEIIRVYHPHTNPQDIPLPGVAGPTPVEYVIEIWQVGVEVPAGSRLMLWVSSSEAPWFIQQIPPATNTILHDAAHPSYVLLPVMPESALQFAGEGGVYLGSGFYTESVEINHVLSYTNPLTDTIQLPLGTTSLPLTVRFSPYMQPGSFEAQINSNTNFGQAFNPVPGTTQTVLVPLGPGVNTLSLRAVAGPGGNQDGERMNKDIDKFTIRVGP